MEITTSECVSCKSTLSQRGFAKKIKLRSLSDAMFIYVGRHLIAYKLYFTEQKEIESIQR